MPRSSQRGSRRRSEHQAHAHMTLNQPELVYEDYLPGGFMYDSPEILSRAPSPEREQQTTQSAANTQTFAWQGEPVPPFDRSRHIGNNIQSTANAMLSRLGQAANEAHYPGLIYAWTVPGTGPAPLRSNAPSTSGLTEYIYSTDTHATEDQIQEISNLLQCLGHIERCAWKHAQARLLPLQRPGIWAAVRDSTFSEDDITNISNLAAQLRFMEVSRTAENPVGEWDPRPGSNSVGLEVLRALDQIPSPIQSLHDQAIFRGHDERRIWERSNSSVLTMLSFPPGTVPYNTPAYNVARSVASHTDEDHHDEYEEDEDSVLENDTDQGLVLESEGGSFSMRRNSASSYADTNETRSHTYSSDSSGAGENPIIYEDDQDFYNSPLHHQATGRGPLSPGISASFTRHAHPPSSSSHRGLGGPVTLTGTPRAEDGCPSSPDEESETRAMNRMILTNYFV